MLTIELTETIAAPLPRAWALVSDPLQQHRFTAYEVNRVHQINACDLGPEFQWSEQGVLMGRRYECECGVFGWEPPNWFCFGTRNLFHVSFELDPVEEGTRLLYRVELPQTPDTRRDAFDELCRKTVNRLKQLLENEPHNEPHNEPPAG
jgi:hypothetical protein